MAYDHSDIEKKAQEKWASLGLYETNLADDTKDPYYLLTEFPYPSGDLHIGHWYAFAVTDIYARMLRLRGKNVLYQIGFDAFGLPAERAAIKHGLDPKEWTYKNMERMRKQLASMGASFDWSKEVVTCDPEYYQWTQWLFSKLFEHGLAERREASVKWCPTDQTVLANEQVVDGVCERCGTAVEEKRLTQWFLKITDYAERLLDGLEKLPWREEIKEAQRAWIGKSEGAYLSFETRYKNVKRFVLLHGKGGSPDLGFLPHLKTALEAAGYEVQVPAMPNASEPRDDEQTEYVLKNSTLDESTVVVGHSFGGIVALRLAERGIKLAGMCLVATPYSPVLLDGKDRPTVREAIEKGFDFDSIRSNAGAISLRYDQGDTIVPASDGEAYARHLKATLDFKVVSASTPHFDGLIEPELVELCLPKVRIFTTRPDTLFGATYVVVAPDSAYALALCGAAINATEVREYIKLTAQKTERERSENKEKTGVKLEGVVAIHPVTQEEVPVYVADYVLGSYGTGAVMAVPAHDERDYEFAKKMGLPIKTVVEPKFVADANGDAALRPDQEIIKREAVCVVVRNPKDDTYLCISWKGIFLHGLVTGGIDEGESIVETARREVREETGYKNLKHIERPEVVVNTLFYQRKKQENRWAHFHYVFFDLENDEKDEVDEKEQAIHEVVWVQKQELKSYLTVFEGYFIVDLLDSTDFVYTKEGTLANSGAFDGRDSEEAKWEIVAAAGGEKATQYRLRDWSVSRQRYWGCPIPIVYDPEGKPHAVPAENLPWLLPTDVDYAPTGKASPLASSKELQERVTKLFGEGWTPEYDTLDTFVDSSWYFARYLDSKNPHDFSSATLMKKWLPVNRYSGGSEHTTMHLLYARFFTKALHDLALVDIDEPFFERFNRGLILGPDGAKMSKSKGNVINPDDFVQKYGADAVRIYLAFIGPYNEPGSYPWSLDGVTSMKRFLDRVERLASRTVHSEVSSETCAKALTIASAKVSEDGDRFKFNTCIAALMIALNELEDAPEVSSTIVRTYLILLAPFAPHLAEHLWETLGGEGSVHQQAWPSTELAPESEKEVVVQVGGKRRGTITLPVGASEAEAVSTAQTLTAVVTALAGQVPKRVIYVPGKILNLVV